MNDLKTYSIIIRKAIHGSGTTISMSDGTLSYKKRVMSAALWLGSLTILSQTITWCITIVVMRILTPADYGLLAMALVYLDFLNLFRQAGLGSAVIQKKEISDGELRRVFGFVVLLNLALLLLVVLLAPWFARFFNEPRLVLILRILSLNFVLISIYFLPQALLMRELDYRRKSQVDLYANLVSAGLVLTLAMNGFGVWSLVWGMIALNLFKAIAFNTLTHLRHWPSFDFRGMGHMFRFGGHIILGRVMWYFYTQSDIIIAGRLFGKRLLGIYSIAMFIVSLPLDKISPVFMQIGFPAVSRIQEDLETVQAAFIRIVRFFNLFSFPAFVGLAMVADLAVPLILGEKWNDAVLPLQLLCMVMPLRFVTILYGPVVNGRGRPEVMTGNMLIACLIMPAAFLIGSRWGVPGLCMAWVLAFPFLFLFESFRVFRVLQLPLSTLFRAMMLPLLASLVMALALFGLKPILLNQLHIIFTIALLVVSGAAVYLAVVLVIKPGTLAEIKAFFSTK